jgi:hypothetical protein
VTRLPFWVAPASRLIIGLQRMGIAFFSFHTLTISGRRSGLMRTTVVSPFTVDGRRYVLSFGDLAWVRNARASRQGTLGRGRSRKKVAIVEILAPDSAPIASEFPRQVPAGVRFFVQTGLVEAPGRPDQFAAAAPELALFRLDPQEA